MFHRILIEEWQRVLSIVSILLFLGVFLVTLLRVARMPRDSVRRMENLPLEHDDNHHEHSH
jgi:hypothetical protein